LGCALALLCLMPVAHARAAAESVASHAESSAAATSAVPLSEAVQALIPDYSQLSHHQLTKIGARWDELDELERRGLLQEVKLRMARQKGKERVLEIRTQRRYGRLVRRSDGQVLRIETKVVQLKPRRINPAERSFGVGFERRNAQPAAPNQPAAPAPATTGEVQAGAEARRISDRDR
jgi:hypothetical protein